VFEAEVWAKVGERTCLRCHNREGEAKESEFVLEKTDECFNDVAITARNHDAFYTMATVITGDQSVLLQKIVGGREHGGGQVLKPDSTGFKILEWFVMRTLSPTSKPMSEVAAGVYKPTPFFEAVTMLTSPRLLRRVTLSLAGRLPTVEELKAIELGGLSAIDSILDTIMREDAFYARLKEGFNDVFLTVGIEDNAETLLSYDHFEKTRLWYQTHDFSHLPEAERERAR